MVANEETFDDRNPSETNYKEQYKEMKRKLRLLIYVSSAAYYVQGLCVYNGSVLCSTSLPQGKRNLPANPEDYAAKTVESVTRQNRTAGQTDKVRTRRAQQQWRRTDGIFGWRRLCQTGTQKVIIRPFAIRPFYIFYTSRQNRKKILSFPSYIIAKHWFRLVYVYCDFRRKEAQASNSTSTTVKQSVSPQTTALNLAKKRKPSTPKVSKTVSTVYIHIY